MRIFTKIIKPVLSTLKKLGYNATNHFDDIFICGDTFAECRDAHCVKGVQTRSFFWSVFGHFSRSGSLSHGKFIT